MHERFAKTALWILGLLPTLVALTGLQVADFNSPATLLNMLGRLTGIAGLAFLLVAALLSSRVPGFDRLFGGLTKLWQTHHLLGAAAFLLLLAHPLLLMLAAADTSLTAAAQTLIPASLRMDISLGWSALLVMMVFLAPSFWFFGEPNYQRWKALHRLAGVAVVLALTHTWLLARTIPTPWNSILWIGLTTLAMGAIAYHFVFSRRTGRLHYEVTDRVAKGNNVVEIHLRPRARHLTYQAGQFVYLTPYDKTLAAGYGQEHPFTLSSAPYEAELRVAVKDLGDASRALQRITPGSEVRIEGPYGAFFPTPSGTIEQAGEDSELWIAGGIGITPFLSRARQLAKTEEKVDIHLIYCVQDPSRALFADEFEQLAKRLPGFRFTPHYFNCEGPLCRSFLSLHCSDYTQRSVYVCGPPPLLSLSRNLCAGSGVQPKRIRTEEFNLL